MVEKTKRRLCKLTWHDRFRQRLDDRFSFKRRKFCRRWTVVVVDVVALPLFGDAAPFRRICDVSCCCCRRCLGWTRSPGRLDPSWLRSGFVVANCCVGLTWFGRTSSNTFRAAWRRLTFAVDDRLWASGSLKLGVEQWVSVALGLSHRGQFDRVQRLRGGRSIFSFDYCRRSSAYSICWGLFFADRGLDVGDRDILRCSFAFWNCLQGRGHFLGRAGDDGVVFVAGWAVALGSRPGKQVLLDLELM